MINTYLAFKLEPIVKAINSVLWTKFLMYALLALGIFYTIYLGFPQITKLGLMFKYAFGGLFKKKDKKEKKDDGEVEVNSFQALATAIAAQVGTGNIGGVATAVASGGPGAIFWMWVSGILGMSTIFAEAVLAQLYKEERDGEPVGGPSYYISKGLKSKPLAIIFSITIILALGFVGNMVQSNSIALAMSNALNVNALYIGIGLAVLVGFVIMGGLKRITTMAELVVPFMALIYIIGSGAILYIYRNHLGLVFSGVFREAFSTQAVIGGMAGTVMKEAIKNGVARGLFSNEAGMGSTPHAHATAKVKDPCIQGFVAMAGVIVDTIVICSITALIVLATDAHMSGAKAVAITQYAFTSAFGKAGTIFLAVSLMFFAFTTIVGWYMFGEMNIRYLFKGKKAINVYRVLVIICIVVGSKFGNDIIWDLADTFNGFMVIPNLIALFLLAPQVKKAYKNYLRRKEMGELD